MFYILGRAVVLVAGAFWIGGLTFYAAAVIPTAHSVLGSHTLVGFITQRVTNWINISGVAALALLFLNLAGTRQRPPARLEFALWGTWVGMGLVQAALFLLHPVLDGMLDASARAIVAPDRFYGLHRIYLSLTMAQLATALVHVVCVLTLWRWRDRHCGDDRDRD